MICMCESFGISQCLDSDRGYPIQKHAFVTLVAFQEAITASETGDPTLRVRANPFAGCKWKLRIFLRKFNLLSSLL